VKIEKIEKSSQSLIKYLKMCGSRGEQIPESKVVGDADGYKITYRICSLFLAPTLPFLKEVLDNEIPTKQEALEITKRADPFLALLLESNREEETFFCNYDFMINAWKDSE